MGSGLEPWRGIDNTRIKYIVTSSWVPSPARFVSPDIDVVRMPAKQGK